MLLTTRACACDLRLAPPSQGMDQSRAHMCWTLAHPSEYATPVIFEVSHLAGGWVPAVFPMIITGITGFLTLASGNVFTLIQRSVLVNTPRGAFADLSLSPSCTLSCELWLSNKLASQLCLLKLWSLLAPGSLPVCCYNFRSHLICFLFLGDHCLFLSVVRYLESCYFLNFVIFFPVRRINTTSVTPCWPEVESPASF